MIKRFDPNRKPIAEDTVLRQLARLIYQACGTLPKESKEKFRGKMVKRYRHIFLDNAGFDIFYSVGKGDLPEDSLRIFQKGYSPRYFYRQRRLFDEKSY